MAMRFLSFSILTAMVVAGCAQPPETPDLPLIYNPTAQDEHPDRNPVIVIPGILGSKLTQIGTERDVWGAFSGDFANPETAEGARLFSLPMAVGVPLKMLHDDVVPNGALDRLEFNLFGLPLELNAYINILTTLGVGGFRDEQLGKSGAIDYGNNHFTCFQFDYDWRRDNVENAKRLSQFILEKRQLVQKNIEERDGTVGADVKFDIVAHSMGGLVARYYLRYGGEELPADGSLPPLTWAGSQYVERVILLGTPNAGATQAIAQLIVGRRFAPFIPHYPAAVLGTMPSIYEMLPRTRHKPLVDSKNEDQVFGDIFDPALWQSMGWGLADDDQEAVLQQLMPGVESVARRREIALDHQAKCLSRARQFTEALDVPAKAPDGLNLYLFAGDAIPTNSVIAVDAETGKMRIIKKCPGDGTVCRSSALMDERVGGPKVGRLNSPIDWDQVMFLFSDHLGLTMDPSFSDNVLFLLLER